VPDGSLLDLSSFAFGPHIQFVVLGEQLRQQATAQSSTLHKNPPRNPNHQTQKQRHLPLAEFAPQKQLFMCRFFLYAGPLVPLLAAAVKSDLAIDNNRHEFITLSILELHDLMTAASQLSPSARLLQILLYGLVLVAVDTECCDPQTLLVRRTVQACLPP
jgi:hypothetical protein